MPRRSSLLDDLHDLFLQTPAWLGPSLALAAYLLLRFLAPQFFPAPTPGLDPLFAARLVLQVATWALPLLILLAWLLAEFSKLLHRLRFNTTTSLTHVRALSWQQFEQLIAEAFRRQGYTALVTGSSTPDGGVDIRLHKNGQLTLVQCKHWKAFAVGVQPIRELLGIITAEKASHGIFVTSGRFTRAAHAFAKSTPLTLIDGAALTRLLLKNPATITAPPPSPTPPSPTTQSPTAPHCPACNIPMTLRTARRGPNAGSHFWGCQGFPTCRQTLPLQAPPTARSQN
jgi:restriction system protein